MKAHTPGPWTWDEGGIFQEATGEAIAYLEEEIGGVRKPLPDVPGGAEHTVPNGLLMAAAPDLLEALEAICEADAEWDDDEEEADSDAARARNARVRLQRKARAAIEKARGQR